MRNLAVPFFALLVACAGPGRSTEPATTPQRASQGSAETGFHKVMASKTLAGHRLTGPGEHPIVMVFFASWCGHCKRELSTLGQLRDEYPEIRIIGLNAYEEFRGWSDKERLKAYLDANAPWLQEVVHADKQMLRDFGGIPKIPSLFVYDRRGQLVAEFRRNKRRLPSPDELEQSLLAALNKE